MDLRKVDISVRNITVVYTKNGIAHVLHLNSIADFDRPLSHHTMTATSPMLGIYNEIGEEIWPGDCAALGKYLDEQARIKYATATTSAKLGDKMKKPKESK